MDNLSTQIRIICLVSILSGILSAMIPKGKMKSSFTSLSSVVLLGAIVISLSGLKDADFSSFKLEKEQVSVSAEYDVSIAENMIYESVICDAVEKSFSEKKIDSSVSIVTARKNGSTVVTDITVTGSFTAEEKIYMVDYLKSCFKNAEINFEEDEND